MENTPTIKTNRLVLRKFTEKDMESLFLILHDEETNRFLPWYPIHNLEETKLFSIKNMFWNMPSHKDMRMRFVQKKVMIPSDISR